MEIETDGLLSSVIPIQALDIIYNIGDAINKIGFGLVIYYLTVSSSKKKAAVA